MVETILELKDVCKSYRDFHLDHVSFSLPKGTIMGFVGANGAGKTTTLKSILGIVHPEGGSISVFGLPFDKQEEKIKEELGVVFDDTSFSDMLTPKNVGSILGGVYHNFNQKAYRDYLDKWSLPINKKIKEFSRGMRMKLSIAAALSHNAKLLLLDEPTSGLDPIARREMLDIFADYILDGEHSILFSSHITSDLEKVCDYITFIHKGKIIISEEKDLLLEQYGILKGGKDEFKNVSKSDILGFSENHFGFAALVKHRDDMMKKYPNLVMDRATIEDIMVFLAGGEE